ncbi:DUF6527 family protein [Nostocoides vanveenii]
MEYSTAVHLCACGCRAKAVTPLASDGWTLTFDGSVTLRPSVGNGQSPCRSHYLITRDVVEWLPPIGVAATRAAIVRDQAAAAAVRAPARSTWWKRLVDALRRRRRSRSG